MSVGKAKFRITARPIKHEADFDTFKFITRSTHRVHVQNLNKTLSEPLRLCACVKRVSVYIVFVNISSKTIYVYIYLHVSIREPVCISVSLSVLQVTFYFILFMYLLVKIKHS